jgi:menaquinone-dependent protoporphyrinogen oxidase
MTDVLVAYASKHGSTAEIAEAIADELRESGINADCLHAGDVKSVERYDGVVVGSAVYMKRWRGEAKRFLHRHANQLAQRPLCVFSSGPVGEPKDDEDRSWLEPPRIVEEVEHLRAREHVVFGGRVASDGGGAMEQAMAKNMPPEYRDRRDWEEIRSWAASIATALHAEAVHR